jgi:hypothetical protein
LGEVHDFGVEDDAFGVEDKFFGDIGGLVFGLFEVFLVFVVVLLVLIVVLGVVVVLILGRFWGRRRGGLFFFFWGRLHDGRARYDDEFHGSAQVVGVHVGATFEGGGGLGDTQGEEFGAMALDDAPDRLVDEILDLFGFDVNVL